MLEGEGEEPEGECGRESDDRRSGKKTERVSQKEMERYLLTYVNRMLSMWTLTV